MVTRHANLLRFCVFVNILLVLQPGANSRYRVLGNSTATFSLPILFNLMSNILLHRAVNSTNASISATMVPLPPREPKLQLNPNLYVAIFLIGLGFTNVITGFVANLVEDKEVS